MHKFSGISTLLALNSTAPVNTDLTCHTDLFVTHVAEYFNHCVNMLSCHPVLSLKLGANVFLL